MGFYDKAELRTPITSVKLASDLAANERPALEALRTDSASFNALVEARRNRKDHWYKPQRAILICAVCPCRCASKCMQSDTVSASDI